MSFTNIVSIFTWRVSPNSLFIGGNITPVLDTWFKRNSNLWSGLHFDCGVLSTDSEDASAAHCTMILMWVSITPQQFQQRCIWHSKDLKLQRSTKYIVVTQRKTTITFKIANTKTTRYPPVSELQSVWLHPLGTVPPYIKDVYHKVGWGPLVISEPFPTFVFCRCTMVNWTVLYGSVQTQV